jgi:hypothetical protein
MFEYIEKRKRLFFEGVELASFLARYPSFPELDKINEFFERIADNSFEWFCRDFYLRVTQKYESDTDADKRFKTPIYKYKLCSTAEDNEDGYLTISLEVTLMRGKKELIASYNYEFCFDKSSELLVNRRKKKNQNFTKK